MTPSLRYLCNTAAAPDAAAAATVPGETTQQELAMDNLAKEVDTKDGGDVGEGGTHDSGVLEGGRGGGEESGDDPSRQR